MKSGTVSKWYCAVAVATVWTSPERARTIDTPGLGNPVRIREWLEGLTQESRLDLYTSKRVQTQVLYGEPVIVEEIAGDWAKVIAVWQSSTKDPRGYPGWIPLAQLKQAVPIRAAGFVKVTALQAQLWPADSSRSIGIPFNSILPYSGKSREYLSVYTPNGKKLLAKEDVELATSIHHFTKKPAQYAVDKGLQFLESSYLWGGMSPFGYDCSGFTYNMLKACGHIIPRDASDQARGGEEVALENLLLWKKGDLLFFADNQGVVRHVGFYFGDDRLLHSPSTGKSVELIKLEDLELNYELCAVRRYS